MAELPDGEKACEGLFLDLQNGLETAEEDELQEEPKEATADTELASTPKPRVPADPFQPHWTQR